MATINERNPALIDSAPNVGPTVSSDTIRAGAGSLPAFKIFTKSSASRTVKFPEIDELPPPISLCTVGKEYTLLSKTIAILLPILSFVNRFQI